MATGHAVQIPHEPARLGPHAHRHHRRRARRGARAARDHYRVLFLIGMLLFVHHLRRQPDRRPRRPRDPEEVSDAAVRRPRFAETPHVAPQGARSEAVAQVRLRADDRRRWSCRCSLIVGYLVVPGLARRSRWSSSSTIPRRGMTRRRHLAGASSARSTWSSSRSLVAAPDRRAGRGLPERIRARQLVQPRRQPGGGQPGRRAEHRARAVRPGRVRAMPPASGYSILAASLTLAIMTLPVIIASTREALAAVPHGVPRGLLERRRHPLADDPHDRAAELDQRHPHRRDPAGVAARPARRRRSCSPARSSSRRSSAGDLFPYGSSDQCMALSMHLYTLATQVPERQGVAPVRHGGGAARARCCSSTRPPSRCASTCAARKKW